MTAEPAAEAQAPPAYPRPVIIEWPAKERRCALPGWGVSITDAETGQPVNTVTEAVVTLHAHAERLITADLTMFADEDGNPAPYAGTGPGGGKAWLRDGEIIMRTFRAVVAEMRVRS